VPDYVVVERAAKTVEEFLEAAGLEERLALTYRPDLARSSMESVFADHPPIADASVVLVEGLVARGIASVCVDVPEAGGIQYFNVMATDETMLVDWPSSSLYQEAHIAEL